jgi:hypothetical protein
MRRSVGWPPPLLLVLLVSSCNPPTAPIPPIETPPVVVTLPSCATWASGLTGDGVPAVTGTVASQRSALDLAGGGVKVVSNRYYAAWFPANWASTSPRRVLVGLHGTGGAPETEWSVDWKDIVSSRGWAYIGLKYVSPSGDHDNETTIYTNVKLMLDDVKASCEFGTPSMFLVGYSRGSAQTFPIAYLDLRERKFFRAIGNNSGAWLLSGPLTDTMRDLVARNELTAYSGTRFWMYCGGQDMEHGYPMCDEMKNARTTIQQYGGHVERLYEDPGGGHGGLTKTSAAWMAMFSYFESLQ